MPDYTIRDPQSGRTATVRGSSPPSEAELADIFKQIPAAQQPGTNAGLALATAGKAGPAAATLASEIATNPNVPRAAAQVGRVVGGVAPVVTGLVEGGPVGGLAGIAASSKVARAGGTIGGIAGRLAQKMTAPMAEVLVKAAPYMQALTTLGGVQSALDLAQMAEPDRKDIGFFGIGKSHPDPDHPALLNLAAAKVTAAISALMGHGLTKDEAAQALVDAHQKKPSTNDQPDYGYGSRWDEKTQGYNGPPKGLGWLGPLSTPDGGVMSEFSRDGEINGQAVQYPLIVPTLTRDEVAALVNGGDTVPASVEQKARAWAAQRLQSGQSPFAGAGEQRNLYPDLRRQPIPAAKGAK